MKIRVLHPRELSEDLLERWCAIQSATPELASPYFRPEYVSAVGEAREDARVGVIEDGQRVAGFFPFQLGALGAADPIGAPLCDFQGVIAEPCLAWDAADLLRGCGITSWRFDHLLASQLPFRRFHRLRAGSPVIDLAAGDAAYAAWFESRRAAGSSRITQLPRKARKLGREIAPLRFESHGETPDVLARVFAWKSAQCRRTGVRDFFAEPWARECVERILHTHGPDFAGLLSALYAGDRLVAAHLGMRSQATWHWWFPVYDAEFARYSPGALLLRELIEAAPGLGIRRIDLGRGEDSYKSSFQTGEVLLAEGLAHVPSFSASWRRGTAAMTRFWRSPAARPLRAPLRAAQRGARRLRRHPARGD